MMITPGLVEPFGFFTQVHWDGSFKQIPDFFRGWIEGVLGGGNHVKPKIHKAEFFVIYVTFDGIEGILPDEAICFGMSRALREDKTCHLNVMDSHP